MNLIHRQKFNLVQVDQVLDQVPDRYPVRQSESQTQGGARAPPRGAESQKLLQ